MDLKKLPPSMLALLGLGGCMQVCLSPPYDGPETSSSSSTGTGTNTVGPCLSPPQDMDSAEVSGSVGPCLGMPQDTGSSGTDTGTETGGMGTETGGTDTGSGTDTGTGTDSDSDGSTTSVGPCLAPPGAPASIPPLHDLAATPSSTASSRHDALERVLSRAALPPDVVERLRRRSNPD